GNLVDRLGRGGVVQLPPLVRERIPVLVAEVAPADDQDDDESDHAEDDERTRARFRLRPLDQPGDLLGEGVGVQFLAMFRLHACGAPEWKPRPPRGRMDLARCNTSGYVMIGRGGPMVNAKEPARGG